MEAAIRTHTQRTVLVVKDDPTLAERIRLLLEEEGWRIVTAGTAEEAIEVARCERPVVIALDLALPDSDGHYVLEELQSDTQLSRVPVIIVSSRFYRPGDGDQVVGVLTEPVDPLELDLLIQRAASGTLTMAPQVAA